MSQHIEIKHAAAAQIQFCIAIALSRQLLKNSNDQEHIHYCTNFTVFCLIKNFVVISQNLIGQVRRPSNKINLLYCRNSSLVNTPDKKYGRCISFHKLVAEYFGCYDLRCKHKQWCQKNFHTQKIEYFITFKYSLRLYSNKTHIFV